MAAKPALIAAGIAGALALGTAAYFANEWRVCSNMEDDYLRTLEGYTSGIYADALAGSVGVEVERNRRKELQDMSIRVQQFQLTAIYQRCGEDAGRTAADLASDEVRESMKDVLTLP